MGYNGKVAERQRARELRVAAWTIDAIAAEVGASKASVSSWVRDVDFVPRPRNRGHRAVRTHPLRVRKLAEIEHFRIEGLARVGTLTDREFLVLGLALYAGEGAKTGNEVRFANCDPRLIRTFVAWLRRYFDIDEARWRAHLYLHDGLDLAAAHAFWSELTGIPIDQFRKPYRAAADPSLRTSKHVMGCLSVRYNSAQLFRRVMGMVEAVVSATAFPG